MHTCIHACIYTSIDTCMHISYVRMHVCIHICNYLICTCTSNMKFAALCGLDWQNLQRGGGNQHPRRQRYLALEVVQAYSLGFNHSLLLHKSMDYTIEQ